MKAHKAWNYSPYKPLFFESGDIYICRVAPEETSISFDWLPIDAAEYEIYIRVKDEGVFTFAGKTTECTFTIENLYKYCDYEFYVCAGEKRSRIRLARCGEHVGTIINYLHPEDNVYDFSGHALCSPDILRHPDGHLLASMDLFTATHPQNLTLIYRSDDDGKTWKYVTELFPAFWTKMFLHKGELYALACNTEYGDLLIGKSTDGGANWSEPTVLFRGLNGKNGSTGIHKNPQPVVPFDGRLWNTLEWGSWGEYYHAVMVMSADENSDLLDADNWLFSEPVKYDPSWEGTAKGRSAGNIEGCLTILDDKLYNIMRYDTSQTTPNYGTILAYEVDTKNPEAPLKYAFPIDFVGNLSKFEIKYHEGTKKYYSIICRITNGKNPRMRNLLSLMVSEDGKNWRLAKDIYNYLHANAEKVGFQYVDFFFEGDDILFQCRTAMNNATNFHDSNYATFDRISLKDLD